MPLTIKYIDPTCTIRFVPAHASDSQCCAAPARSAVHGAMAGYSGRTVDEVNERYAMRPIYAVTVQQGRRADAEGRSFHRLLETTSSRTSGQAEGPL